jgi:PAS domain-containing protein
LLLLFERKNTAPAGSDNGDRYPQNTGQKEKTMKKVCAWCRRELESFVAEHEQMYPVTHGICDTCAADLLMQMGRPLQEFLDSLDVPILLIESGPLICTANRQARKLLDKQLTEIEGRRGGDVIECVHAKLPEGCGNTVHCKSCTIRITVLETFTSGISSVRVPAYPDIQTVSGVKTMRFLITTEKVGNLVLLRIEDKNGF